jgi:cytochrome c-type protein NapB
MFKKRLYVSIVVSTAFGLTLSAMDMDRVNALAEQFKSGQVVKKVVVAPSKVEIKETKVEVVKVVVPKKHVGTIIVTNKPQLSVSEESLGLRKTDLYSEASDTVGEATVYGKVPAGSSKRFDRAFENAPPMIPHDVEGMLPIKIGNNACTGCHLPEVAKSMNATPIPASHFASFRPTTAIGSDGRITKEGKGVSNTSDFKTVVHALEKLSSARFNCSQCHAPQSTQKPLVGNTFTPDFSSEGSMERSNLIDVINEGVQ